MAQIQSWDDLCFPVSSQPLSELLNYPHQIVRSRQQAVIVDLTPPSSEDTFPLYHITAIQGPDYEVIPNSLIRHVADQVLGEAGISYRVEGQQYGFSEFRFQLILEEKPLAIGNPKDIIYAAINISNNYSATGHLTISGKALEQKKVIYADRYDTIPAFSVYRQICQNGLWGWKDVNEMQMLTALANGEKVRKNWRKDRISRRQIESPAQLQVGEELGESIEQAKLLDDHKKVSHRRGAAEYTEKILTDILTNIVAQYEQFTKSPAIRMYNVLYDRKIENPAARLSAVMEQIPHQQLQRKWAMPILDRVLTEMNQLGEKVANDWLVYNAINYHIWKNQTKQSVFLREKADASVFQFLLTSQ